MARLPFTRFRRRMAWMRDDEECRTNSAPKRLGLGCFAFADGDVGRGALVGGGDVRRLSLPALASGPPQRAPQPDALAEVWSPSPWLTLTRPPTAYPRTCVRGIRRVYGVSDERATAGRVVADRAGELVMAGGSGKYNRRLVADLAEVADEDVAGGCLAGPREAPESSDTVSSTSGGLALPASRRHCWALGPAEDPGPHPALLTGSWVKRESEWFVKATWYSESEDSVVQQWLPAAALRPVR